MESADAAAATGSRRLASSASTCACRLLFNEYGRNTHTANTTSTAINPYDAPKWFSPSVGPSPCFDAGSSPIMSIAPPAIMLPNAPVHFDEKLYEPKYTPSCRVPCLSSCSSATSPIIEATVIDACTPKNDDANDSATSVYASTVASSGISPASLNRIGVLSAIAANDTPTITVHFLSNQRLNNGASGTPMIAPTMPAYWIHWMLNVS